MLEESPQEATPIPQEAPTAPQIPEESSPVPQEVPSAVEEEKQFPPKPHQVDVFGDLNNGPDRATVFESIAEKRKEILNAKAATRTALLTSVAEMTTQSSNDLNTSLLFIRERTKLHRARYEMLGDAKVRQDAAIKLQAREIKSLVELSQSSAIDDQALAYGAAIAAQKAARQDIAVKERYALEKSAVERLVDLGIDDPHQQAIMLDSLNPSGTIERMEDFWTKGLMVEAAIDSLGLEDRSAGRKVIEWVADNLIFFLDEGTSSVDPLGEMGWMERLVKSVNSGKYLEDASHRFTSMTPEQQAEMWPQIMEATRKASSVFGLLNKSEQARLLSEFGVKNPSNVEKFVVNAADVLTVLPYKYGATAYRTMRGAGATTQAARLAGHTIRAADSEGLEAAARASGMTPEEVIEAGLPDSMVLNPDPDFADLSADIARVSKEGDNFANKIAEKPPEEIAREEGGAAIRELGDNGRTRLNQHEEEAAWVGGMRDAEAVARGRPITGMRIERTVLADRSIVDKSVFNLGRVDGVGGFQSQATAARLRKRYALAGREVQDASGQWYAEVEIPLREDGFYEPIMQISASTKFGRFFRGGAQQGDENLGGNAQIGGRLQAEIFHMFEQIWKRANGKLSGKQRNALDTILEMNTEDNVWLNPQELARAWDLQTGQPLPPMVADSYRDIKLIRDIEYVYRDDVAYKQRMLQGKENVKIADVNVEHNANITRDISNSPIPKERAYDVSGRTHYNSLTPLDDATWARMKNEGYVKVRLEETVELPDGTFVNTFLSKPRDIEVSPLRRNQMPYKPGVHRAYSDKYLAKQASRGYQPDTGKEVLKTPKTFRTFPSQKMADEWATVMNAASDAYNNAGPGQGLVAVHRVFQGLPEFPTPQRFVDDINAGRFDPYEKIETVYDGELPKAYSADLGIKRYIGDEGGSAMESMGHTQGRLFYSKRGDRLEGYDGSPAPVLRPSEAINDSINNVAKLAGFDDYKIESALRLYNTFRPHILASDLPEHATIQQVIRNAKMKPNTDPRIVAKFETQRAVMGRVLNHPTPFDNAMDSAMRVLDDRIAEIAGQRGVAIARWKDNKNPFDALRAMAFHLKLGMFNAAQFTLQASTSAQAALLADGVVNMSQAFTGGILMRFASQYRGGVASKILDKPAMWKALGFASRQEAKEMMDAYAATGWGRVDNSHMLISSKQGTVVGSGQTMTKAKDALHKSGLFFYEAERWNRGVAFFVAWRELQQKGLKGVGSRRGAARTPTVASGKNPHFMRQVMKAADDYSFQMTAESRSAWQKGPASISTQFWSYQTRMLEMMLGKTLTGQQRAKLVAGQAAMYGSMGVPGVAVGVKMLQEHQGSTPETGSAAWILDRGFWDSLIYFSTGGLTGEGADIAVGERIGTGSFFTDMIGELRNHGKFGDVSWLDVTGGAGWQIGSDIGKDTWNFAKLMWAVNGDLGNPLIKDKAIDVGRNISSVNNAYRTWVAHQYGYVESQSGKEIAAVTHPVEMMAIAMGISPANMHDISARTGYLENRKAKIDDNAKEVAIWLNEWHNKPDKQSEIADRIQALKQIVDDPRDWLDIMQLANRYANGESLDEITAQRILKERAIQDAEDEVNKRKPK